MLCESHTFQDMLTHVTTRHTLKNVSYVNIPTYESGAITMVEEDGERLEIQGLTPSQINEAIKSYVQSCGYHLSADEVARTSGFLSELQDTVAAAIGRMQRELEKTAD